MLLYDIVLTTGEARFLEEDLFQAFPGQFEAEFAQDGNYVVRARIKTEPAMARLLEREVARMRVNRLRLDVSRRLPATQEPPREGVE